MGDRRRLTRPRTRVYDCNYNIGENYYRPALERLDRKYGGAPIKPIEPPRRPVSVGDLESLLGEPREEIQTNAALAAINQQIADDLASSQRRIERARIRDAPTPEENFENAFFNRREAVKQRFSEKLLDSVGINGAAIAGEEDTSTLRRRMIRRVAEFEDEIERPKVEKWSALALREPHTNNPSFEDTAAKSRARISRARLADLENEMVELAERGAARERRLAGLREILGENQDTVRVRKTVTIREKRVV